MIQVPLENRTFEEIEDRAVVDVVTDDGGSGGASPV
jgi:hypothetical protein